MKTRTLLTNKNPIGRTFLLAIFIFSSLSCFNVQAATYYLIPGADASSLSSWSSNQNETVVPNPVPANTPTVFTAGGQNNLFVIQANEGGYVGANWAFGNGVAGPNSVNLDIYGTLTINNDKTLNLLNSSNTAYAILNVKNGGTLIFEETGKITSSTFGVLNNVIDVTNGSTLITANLNGILSNNGSIIPSAKLTTNFSPGANYIFNGTDQTTNGLPSTVNLLTFSNTGTKKLANDVVCDTLTINGTANLDIDPGKMVSATQVNNNAGNSGIVILASESLPSGSLVFHNSPSSPVPATVEFYSKASITDDVELGKQYHYQFFGIPFTGMQPLGNLDGSYIFRHNEMNVDMWEPVTNNTPMTPITGYAITQAAPTTYTMTGNLFNQPFFMPLSYSFMNLEIGDYKIGEHIIANPYTAAIPISSMDFFGIEQTVYLYNTGSYDEWSAQQTNPIYQDLPGQYLSVPQELAGQEGLPASIPGMQGFMVKVLPPKQPAIKAYNPDMQLINNLVVPGGGLLLISYPSAKNEEPLRLKKADTEKVITTIDISGQRFSDKIWLFTEPNCTKGFDNGYDGRKIMGSAMTPQFYAVEEDGNYQVNAVNDINNTLFGFKPGVDTEYTMKFTHYNTAMAYPQGIYLLDLVTDDVINVTQNGSTYTFATGGSSYAKGMKAPAAIADEVRFKIVTAPRVVTGTENLSSSINVFASGKNLIIDNKTALQGELMLFDASGRNLIRKNIDTGLSTIRVDIPTGAYIAQVITKDVTVKSTLIIK